jgi:hypothetical protein
MDCCIYKEIKQCIADFTDKIITLILGRWPVVASAFASGFAFA